MNNLHLPKDPPPSPSPPPPSPPPSPSTPINISPHPTILELHTLYRSGITLFQVIESLFQRVDQTSSLNIFLFFNKELILKQAEELEKQRLEWVKNEKPFPPLFGIPISIKDNIHVLNHPTTCASQILKGFVPPFECPAIQALRGAGALFFGKTNCDEFAMGGSCENSGYGPTKNPLDPSKVPGGSSGGSAASVAAGLCPLSLGSDTGGSVRQPASFTGILGYKPSYGLVSRYGLVAYASSLDQIGPMGNCLEDVETTLQVISMGGLTPESKDPDMTHQTHYLKLKGEFKKDPAKKWRCGYPVEFMASQSLHPEVKRLFALKINQLKSRGVEVHEIPLPILDYSLPAYYVIATAEASSNLARYDGIRYGNREGTLTNSLMEVYQKTRSLGFGEEVLRRILMGTFVLSSGYYDAYYHKALAVRQAMIDQFQTLYEEFDFIVTPTAPGPAFDLGQFQEDPLKLYLQDICTLFVNLIGGCGLSLPMGKVDNLPVGFQIAGKRDQDPKLFHFAREFFFGSEGEGGSYGD